MKRISILLLCLTSLFAVSAQAQNSLLGGRIGAKDPVTLAEFYKSVFGLYQVDQFNFQDGGIEVMLNFGSTEAEAKANTNAEIVLFPRPSDDVEDDIPHLIFNVSDIKAVTMAIKDHGGTMDREPFPLGGGMMIGIAKDPAGNQIELIQRP